MTQKILLVIFVYFIEQVLSLAINPIQKCQQDSASSCHFPRLSITDKNPHFIPIADNVDVIKSVSFKQSFVPVITEDIFEAFPNLQIYDGENTFCTKISENAFQQAKNLEIVRLSDNKFTEIEALAFNGASNITSISFKYNQVTKIDENAFNNLLELESLDFGCNLLEELPANVFQNNKKLKILYFNGNLLQNIVPGLFNNLRELRWISFSVNRLHTFPVAHLADSVNLEILWLYSNRLVDLNAEKMVKQFPRLAKCHINDNYFRCGRLQEILTVFHEHHVNETANPYAAPRERPYITHKISFDAKSVVDCLTEEQAFAEVAKDELLPKCVAIIMLVTIGVISLNVIGFVIVKRKIVDIMANNNNGKVSNTEAYQTIDKLVPNLKYLSGAKKFNDNETSPLDKTIVYRTPDNNVTIRDISEEKEGPVKLRPLF